MKRYLIPVVLFATAILQALAIPENDPVLMTINGKDVYQSEFEYLYNKNKLQQIKPQSIEEYLEMFIIYKLKVADAEAAGIDTVAAFRNEFDGYCMELAQPYLEKHSLTGDDIIAQLSKREPAFRNVMNEYREGMLLFEISNRNVWEQSTADKIGLEQYFKAHVSDYKWDKPHYKGYVIYALNDSVAQAAEQFLNNTNPVPEKLASSIREEFGRNVKIERVITAKGDNPMVDHIAFSAERPAAKGRWTSWFGYLGCIIESPEEAADVRGAVTADYQQELEKAWIKTLREKYPVKLNDKVVRQLKE